MDKRLIDELKSGSEAALYQISGGFSGYVMTVIRNFSGGRLAPQDIEELCGEVFWQLWLHRENLDGSFGLKPYLSVCAKNAVKNRLRSVKITPEDIDDADIPSELSTGLSVERVAELHEMMEHLNKALSELARDDREVFLRYFFYGEKTADIARAMGINENTARSKLSRTRSKIKKYLEQRGFDHV